MFGIGGFELLIIVIFIFVIFGPDKMPEITKYAGKALKKFRNAKEQVDDIVNAEVVEPIIRESNKPDTPKPERKPEVTSAQVNEANDNAAKAKEAAKESSSQDSSSKAEK